MDRYLLSPLRSPGLSAVLLLALVAVVYAPTLGYGFVYEDLNAPERLSRSVLDTQMLNPARMLTELSTELGMAISGSEPWGHHLISVAIHLLNVVLVGVLAWQIVPAWGAVLAMAVFGLHPVSVEAVAYVSARADLVSTTGLLLALLATSLGSLTGAVVGVVLASLGKEAALVAWGLVPLWALATKARFPVGTWLVMASLAVIPVALYVLRHVSDITIDLDPGHLGRTTAAIWRLLLLIVVPIGQSIDHDWYGVPVWLHFGSVMAFVIVTAYAIAEAWASRAWWAWGWLAIVVSLAPRLLVPRTEGLHEHHLYAVLVLWSLIVGAWVSHAGDNGARHA